MIQSEAQPQAEFWEPWQPQIGQRVRVRLSGECQVAPGSGSYAEDFGAGHPREFDGVDGVVVDPKCIIGPLAPQQPGHCYSVKFDSDVKVPGVRPLIIGADFAAIELEPLDA